MAKAKSEMPAEVAEVAAPVVEVPAYDRDNLDAVIKKLRALSLEVKTVSGDLAAHHRRHSRVHHVNGDAGSPPLEAPAAPDPYVAGRLHTLLAAIGTFTHAVESFSL